MSQVDLENIITLRAQIKRLERNVYMIEHSVIEHLAAGAEVEDGRRTAELLSKFEDGEQIHWIEVN